MKFKISNISQSIVIIFFYITLIALGVYRAFSPGISTGFSLMQTDPGDTRLNNYFLEHLFQTFFNQNYLGTLWSPTFFYPYKEVLAFSDNLIGSFPIYAIFRFFSDPDIAFHLWMIGISVLNFICFALVLRKFQVSHLLAGLGGFLFAFGMPRVAKIGHQQMLPHFFTPLAFICLWEFVKEPTKKRLTLFLLLVYAQILAGIYLGWFLLFTTPIFLIVTYILSSNYREKVIQFWQKNVKQIVGIFTAWLTLVVITLLPYIKAKFVLGGRSYGEIDAMLPRLASWFAAPPGSIWFPKFGWISEDLPLRGEHFMFIGLTVVILTLVSIFTLFKFDRILSEDQKLIAKICVITFIIIFCISLRLPFGITLWKAVYWLVPGASVIRAVARIWTIAYFYLFIGIFVCWDALLNTIVYNKYLRLFVTTIILVLAISEQHLYPLASYEKAPWLAEEDELAKLMSNECAIAYVAMDPSRPAFANHLTAMWGGIKANVPVINGYSGNIPPGYKGSFDSLNTAEVISWFSRTSKEEITGNFCFISPSQFHDSDLIKHKTIVESSLETSEKYALNVIQLPLEKQFSQEIQLLNINSSKVAPSSTIKISGLIKNTSNFLWNHEETKAVNFSYRWLDAQGNLVIFEGDGDRTQLPWDVSPGETVALSAKIRTPPTPGTYTLLLTMVQENVAWFNDETDTALAVPIEIVAQ